MPAREKMTSRVNPFPKHEKDTRKPLARQQKYDGIARGFD